jgi:acylglycerol lipase
MLNVPSLYKRQAELPSIDSKAHHTMSPTTAPITDPNQGLNHNNITLSSGTIAHVWKPDSQPIATIVLQHGYAEYATRYIHSHHNLITHFLAANYAVYALDIWAHGSSPGTTRAVVHVGKAVADHLELRSYAVQLRKPVILFGHSLGGLITAGSVVNNAENISGVILTGPAFPGPFPYAARVAVGVAARTMPTVSIPGREVDISGLTRSQEEIDKYLADPLFSKKAICFLTAATAVDVSETVTGKVGEWTVPTMVLHGNADTYCDWKVSERFVQAIRSADKELGVYEDGRHELLHDECGDEVLERVLRWVQGHL